jgi:VanZ family protein
MRSAWLGTVKHAGWAAAACALVGLALGQAYPSGEVAVTCAASLLGSSLLAGMLGARTGTTVTSWPLAFALSVLGAWVLSAGPPAVQPRFGDAFVYGFGLPMASAWLAATLLAFWDARRSRSPQGSWLASVIALSAIIAGFSGQAGGAAPMHGWIQSLFGLDPETAGRLTIVLRKALHFLVYGSLAWFAFRSARAGGIGLRAGAALGIALAGVMASFDEARQSSSIERTGSVWDLLLDGAGMALFVGLAILRDPERRGLSNAQTD